MGKFANKYLGAIHIHSLYSDGTGDVDVISKAAKKNGLSWIVITDHNNLDIEEGFINGVFVIKGEEISPYNENHYLALGINELINPSDNCQEFVEEVRLNNGFGFAAHPDESETRKNFHRPIRWKDKSIHPDGVEIWNWFSSWADNYNDKNIFNIIYAYLFKKNLVRKPARESVKWWDDLNGLSENIVSAIGGIDAHALKIRKYIIPVTVFPYEFMLGTIVNQVLLKEELSVDFETAKNQILLALKNGNNIIANISVSKNIPEIYVTNANDTAQCGESIGLDENTYLCIKCPKALSVKIYKDGVEIYKEKSKYCRFKITQTGKYRVETEIDKYGFAYSNPIIVK